MVRRLCGSGDGVEAVEGVAGAGKTTGLRVARTAWEAAGYAVVGCALAARAARELDRGAGIPSSTLDRLLRRLDRGESGGLGPRTVLVVDEAAMVGTRKLAKLLHHAERMSAKVVLVGDRHQLPAMDAGGAFAAIADRLGATRLAENRRQRHEWEREALVDLRTGDVARALDAYLERGRVHGDDDVEVVRDQLVPEWWAARQAGQAALMVASRNAEVDELNWRARAILRGKGHIGPDVVIGERAFAVGDEVLATRNDYELGVLNGTRATVTAIAPWGAVSARTPDGQRLELPRDYVEAGHLTHAYATTIHKAQGATVARALVVGDDALAREPAYTGLSRGVERNDLYLVGGSHRREEHHGPEDATDRLDEVVAAVGRTLAERLASDQIPDHRLLAAERSGLERRLHDRPTDHAYELGRIADDRARLQRFLASAKQRAAQAEAKLGDLGGLRGLTRRAERQHFQRQLTGCREEQAHLLTSLAHLDRREAALRPEQDRYDRWAAEHQPELERTRMIDRLQASTAQQAQLARTRELGIERDTGFGIEL